MRVHEHGARAAGGNGGDGGDAGVGGGDDLAPGPA